MKRLLLLLAVWLMGFGMALAQPATGGVSGATPPSLTRDSIGPIAALQKALARGDLSLEFKPPHGYLLSLLHWLQVPVSSQTLVFSKTSSQRRFISPQTPRALYFNDDVYVTWVPQADVIEVSEVDPQRGAIFYTLSQRKDAPPAFQPRQECLQCHDGLKTMGVPGHLMGSTFTAPDGEPLFPSDRYMGGHRSPLSTRWGGWYVTGTHVGDVHLGNAFLLDKARPASMDLSAGANLTDLRGRCDISLYPSAHSDIVALLVLEHQVRLHNLMAQVSQLAGRGEEISIAAEALLEYMLFRDEAPLKGPVRGTSTFASEFQSAGPRDSKGRSLRQLDLETRLLRFPCSYLIYSAAFDSLPIKAKQHLWRRLEEILTGHDTGRAYTGMANRDKEAVLEILTQTKPEFANWRKSSH